MVHRDRFDPEVGPAHAVAHVATETAIGAAVLVVAGVAVVAAAAAALARR